MNDSYELASCELLAEATEGDEGGGEDGGSGGYHDDDGSAVGGLGGGGGFSHGFAALAAALSVDLRRSREKEDECEGKTPR